MRAATAFRVSEHHGGANTRPDQPVAGPSDRFAARNAYHNAQLQAEGNGALVIVNEALGRRREIPLGQ
jgi:hypothetical protein